MVPLYDVTAETGGLEVIPDTNNDKIQSYLKQEYPKAVSYNDDWVRLY